MQHPKKIAKIGHLGTIAQLCQVISSQLRHVSTIKKNLLSSNISCTCPNNMVNFSPLAAEIGPVVWGTPANFNGFRVLAALLHGTVVVGISQTLRHWTEGATYIRQGGHHTGHWPTFLVQCVSLGLCCVVLHSAIRHHRNNTLNKLWVLKPDATLPVLTQLKTESKLHIPLDTKIGNFRDVFPAYWVNSFLTAHQQHITGYSVPTA